jgi:hypothetical protein
MFEHVLGQKTSLAGKIFIVVYGIVAGFVAFVFTVVAGFVLGI